MILKLPFLVLRKNKSPGYTPGLLFVNLLSIMIQFTFKNRWLKPNGNEAKPFLIMRTAISGAFLASGTGVFFFIVFNYIYFKCSQRLPNISGASLSAAGTGAIYFFSLRLILLNAVKDCGMIHTSLKTGASERLARVRYFLATSTWKLATTFPSSLSPSFRTVRRNDSDHYLNEAITHPDH